jgi:CHAT domain-containing protein
VLGQDSNATSDGFWSLNEIKMEYIPSKLIILSACETAFGSNLRGENSLGLSRAFLVAGAENILATLWKINDRSSATFVASLFEQLTERDKKRSSFLGKIYSTLSLSEQSMRNVTLLSSVKRKMIKTKEYHHPYYWAPFILIGA